MVYSRTSIVKLPFSNATLHTKNKSVRPTGHGLGTGLGAGLGRGLGAGMGSVLLRTGGGGAGSSYSDIDDYIHTTHINPYTRSNQSVGSGLSSLSSKLSKLSIGKNQHPIRRNIVMDI
jgi:hypothetical protein